LLKLSLNFPATKDFIIQPNNEIESNKTKTACLLKSKTSLVQGKKINGVKNIAAKNPYFETQLQIFNDENRSFIILFNSTFLKIHCQNNEFSVKINQIKIIEIEIVL